MLTATVIKSDENYYLVCSKDAEGAILINESPENAVREIEDTYDSFHKRGYESSMSACVHNLMFKPAIVQIPDTIEEVKKLLESEGMPLVKIHSIAGSYYGRKIKVESIEELLKTAILPRLVRD